MLSSLALLGLAVALFASTNIDDVFVLVGFFSDPKLRVHDIVIGQYVGLAGLFGISVAASMLSLVIPRAYIGLLGTATIVIGVKKLFELYRDLGRPEKNPESHPYSLAYGRSATVAIVTIANGGDNIGIYTPSFAIHSGYEIAVIALVFIVLTALWCFIAHSIVHHPRLGIQIRRYGHRVAPVMFIVLGTLVLYQAGSFGLLFHHNGQ